MGYLLEPKKSLTSPFSVLRSSIGEVAEIELQMSNTAQIMIEEQKSNNSTETAILPMQYYQQPFFSRVWEMPNSKTFNIKCIRKLIHKYLKPEMLSIDPFANESKLAKVHNDLNPEMDTDYHLDAVDFLKMFDDKSVDFCFYDPPYSLRQVSEMYKSVGREVTMETTQSSWRTKHINEISRIVKPDGIVMSFGWNSSGVGKKRGFEIIEIMLVAHGGSHNDTICTVERKLPTLF